MGKPDPGSQHMHQIKYYDRLSQNKKQYAHNSRKNVQDIGIFNQCEHLAEIFSPKNRPECH